MHQSIKFRIVAVILASTMLPATQALAEGTWTITPRVWRIDMTIEDENSANPDSFKDLNLYGFSIDYAPETQKNIRYTLSYFTSGGTYSTVMKAGGIAYNNDEERRDVELLVRYHLPDSVIYLLGGYRRMDIDGEVRAQLPVPMNMPLSYEYNSDIVEFGASLATPIFKNSDRHHVFANVIFGYGTTEILSDYADDDRLDTTIIDTNIGYQYLVTDNLSINARYRSLTYTLGSNITSSLDGPELGLSYRF